ncbi:PAS domain-containing protein [Shimia haliotis]|uniref:Aerotaxis receptor n=1 Tax=Shimia haliotis TaxID=1280847 RepID=A0A1I4HHF1_9RHOB|nr:PAS domain-containing protein [Shimia haliotis]SFL41534.1 aerotaxis receptor [Shimia haliotis]
MNAITQISPATNSQDVTLPREAVLTTATDPRSMLTFVSKDFADLSGFDVDHLIGSPHKVVRHPDTPRGIFHLLWDSLKSGQAVYLYVKNQTAAGDAYWSLATHTITDNGFMSARIRPSSSLFEKVKDIYSEMLNTEAGGASPEESAAWFISQIQSMGYTDLLHLGSDALNSEFKARGDCDPQFETSFRIMDEILQLVEEMRELAEGIEGGFKRVRGEPVNLRILAGRLEGAGAALGTISQNYDAMAQEMYELLGRLHAQNSGALHDMFFAVSHARANEQCGRLLDQSIAREEQFLNDGEQCVALRRQQDHLNAVTTQCIREISHTGKPIPDICRSLRRRINGLDVVKLLCKVESGRMRDVDSGLDGIIDRLQAFHDGTDKGLAELSSKASQIQQKINAF